MVDQHGVALREEPSTGAGPAADAASPDLVAEVLAACGPGGARHVACAPGRLDVLGGIAESTGGLVLAVPSPDHHVAVCQRRDDGRVVVRLIGAASEPAAEDVTLPVGALQRADGSLADCGDIRRLAGSGGSPVSLATLATLVELLRDRPSARLDGGWTLAAGATVEPSAATGAISSICAAAAASLNHAMNLDLDTAACAAACRRVENHWLGWPVDASDALCALAGRAHSIAQIRCDATAIDAGTALPDDVLIAGIDSGVVHEDARERNVLVRTAAMMGRLILDRIIQHEPRLQPNWSGRLAQISMADFVKRFRDRIPTKLKGRDFLARFGETGDTLTRVEPDHVYKVRSRTEHHIYESERSRAFVESLARARRLGRPDLYLEAGDLMFASHWSYGQRCGLGSIETDLLVNLLKEHGRDGDVFGAKISGRGCGGTVVVMLRSTQRARAALHAAVADYAARTGLTPRILEGSLPGALVSGVRKV